jgi:hypothetical protein
MVLNLSSTQMTLPVIICMYGHCATSRKVAGSISNEVIGFFNLPNPCSHIMSLELTQPLT